MLRGNNASAVTVSGGSSHVLIRNSAIVVGNTYMNQIPAIALQSGADIEMTYSTVVDNFAGIDQTGSLVCSGSSGFVRNSIVLGTQANSIAGCAGVTFEYNALDTAASERRTTAV